MRIRFLCGAWAAAVLSAASGQEIPRGQVVDSVTCASDESQRYALYLPSNYSPERQWNVIFLFDPGGRGRRGVERYQAAAEQYGYILAGSNNSRNGPWEISLNAARAMRADVMKRFSVNPRRIYTAGHSGGSRVAMAIALEQGGIAGVLASSAAFPGDPIAKLDFPVFGTAGTEDFNYLEMRQFDELVTTPHRIEVFRGGHTWPPAAVAMRAVEWMELQAMKSGLRTRDDALVSKIFEAWKARASAAQGDFESWRALDQLASDLAGLHDVSEIRKQAEALRKRKSVADALASERADQETEARTLSEIARLEQGLGGDREIREGAIDQLQSRFLTMIQQANAPEDTAQRRMIRRILAGTIAGARGLGDEEYTQFLDRFRPPAPPE
jgi:pimeloyl-ACP methyl ester carboxylesterase